MANGHDGKQVDFETDMIVGRHDGQQGDRYLISDLVTISYSEV